MRLFLSLQFYCAMINQLNWYIFRRPSTPQHFSSLTWQLEEENNFLYGRSSSSNSRTIVLMCVFVCVWVCYVKSTTYAQCSAYTPPVTTIEGNQNEFKCTIRIDGADFSGFDTCTVLNSHSTELIYSFSFSHSSCHRDNA